MRGQVVERLLGARTLRKGAGKRAGHRAVLVDVSQVASDAEQRKLRLFAVFRMAHVAAQHIARGAIASVRGIERREPDRDQIAIVVVDAAAEALVGAARRRRAPRVEQRVRAIKLLRDRGRRS